MNKQMILLALAAGSLTAIGQYGISKVLVAHHAADHPTPYDLMANQPDPTQPLQQVAPGRPMPHSHYLWSLLPQSSLLMLMQVQEPLMNLDQLVRRSV